MITLTELDCSAFNTLCGLFAPEFDSFTPFVPSSESCFYCSRKLEKREAMTDLSGGWPWISISMDKNLGIIDGITANFWDDIQHFR
jgi:hypothetical protein